MRRYVTLLFVLVNALPGAVVLDRMAVIVGNHAIKLSQIQRDLRLTAFLNRQPVDLSGAEMRKSAERLVDQTVIRDEIAHGGYQRPSESDAAALLRNLVRDRFGGSDARLREALAHYGFTEEQLSAELLWQLTVLRFIDQRFRPGVQVTDDEVSEYYNQHLAEFKRDYPRNHSLTALQTQIRASLEGERVNKAFSTWLEEARKRVRIVYEEGAFQ